jgi:hypothetical protein
MRKDRFGIAVFLTRLNFLTPEPGVHILACLVTGPNERRAVSKARA